jgi:two-component system, OmpR family, sensor histidine kinase KdpD
MSMSNSGQRGRLKILLGYAAGVGKTYKALEELLELQQQGKDVVVGYFEPHGRKDTISKTQGLEIIPRRKISYRGASFEEMDVEAILRRNPQVCMVDEFAHTNVPGSERSKRWEDVQVLLDAGIDVLTNLNVQHLESLNDQVTQFSGIRVRETIPDWVVKKADEVVMVDLPPQALLNRLKRGVVYTPDKANRALESFFKEPTLVALRELALRQAAHEIDVRQDVPKSDPSPVSVSGREGTSVDSRRAKSEDRILIHVSPDPSTAALIRRGKRVADFLDADCFAVCVLSEDELQSVKTPQREALSRHLNFARNLQIETQVLQGEDDAQSLVQFAREHQITQLFVLRPRAKVWHLGFGRNLVQQVVRLARDMQVTVVAERHRA